MIHRVFALRDAKVGFLSPNLDKNEKTAIRNLEAAMKSPDSMLSTHAADFDLWEIATFDDETGIISAYTPITLVCSVASLKKEV